MHTLSEDKIKANQVEGDINLTATRKQWQDKFLSEKSKKLLDEDSIYFFHQALSSPCLDPIKKVDGIYIYDEDDRKIMDFHGNSVHQLGYNNPYLLQALQTQLQTLSFSPRRYSNQIATKLAKKLTTLAGGNRRVLFTPSGTASIGVALKMVRRTKGKFKTLSLWNSFHGAGLDAISVGGEYHFRNNIGPLLPGTEHFLPYNSYRCIFGDCSNCNLKCLDYLEYICKCEGDIGAILMEPIRCTDVQIPTKEYYQRLRSICDTYDIALIFDEIPTAFGRTGKMFAYQNYDIEPDILVVGKGLGGSLYPLSAVIGKEEFNICQDTSLGHYTHEKSPLGCAIGNAVIEYIENNNILSHVKELETILYTRTKEMKAKFECIGDVRLIGALLGIELVKNRQTKEKATVEAEKVLYLCLEQGLSFKISQGCVLTLAPPLIISPEELNLAMDKLEYALTQVFRHNI